MDARNYDHDIVQENSKLYEKKSKKCAMDHVIVHEKKNKIYRVFIKYFFLKIL